MTKMQYNVLSRVIDEKSVLASDLSVKENDAAEYLCQQHLLDYSVEGGLHYFSNEKGSAYLEAFQEEERRRAFDEKAAKRTALRSWVAIFISIAALLLSLKAEIALLLKWLLQQLK